MTGKEMVALAEHRSHAAIQVFFALTIILMFATGGPQGEAADQQPSVASHIPSAGMRGAPVTVIDRNDIEMSGIRNLYDLLTSRRSYNSFGVNRPYILGGGRVAVLVNGRRVSDSGVNLATLPISAVERIEILSDSAAGMHGGHASGGAVNIVLTRGHEGAAVSAQAYRPTGSGADSEHGSALWGGAVGDGHVVMGVDFLREQEIRGADRDYSRARWTPGGPFDDTLGVGTGNTLTIVLSNRSDDPDTFRSETFARPLGHCRGNSYTGVLKNPGGTSGTGCGFAYANIAWELDRYKRGSAFVNLDHPLGRDADMYFDARLARSDTTGRAAPPPGPFSFTPSQELRDALLADPEISAELQEYPDLMFPDKLTVNHRFVSHGNRDSRTDLDEYDITLGLRGQLARGLGYDAHLRYRRSDAVEKAGNYVSATRAKAAIESGDYDLKNPLNPTDPERHGAAVRETALRLTRTDVADHKTARLSFNGPAFALRGGDARWAAGAEVDRTALRDIYDYRDADNTLISALDVIGSAGNSYSGRRRRWSLFAEVSLPLYHPWDVTVAGRRDDHNDVGDTFSYQVSTRVRLNEGFAVRGSWGRSSRPPDLFWLHLPELLSYPRVCDTTDHTGPLQKCTLQQVETVFSGNPDLEPDEAESVGFGAVASLGALSLSADWFHIELSDTPTILSTQALINLEAREEALPPGAAIEREGTTIRRIRNPSTNSGETTVSGVDLRGRAAWETDWADLVLAAHWLRVIQYRSRAGGVTQPGDFRRHRVHASLQASRGRFTVGWHILGHSGYWNRLRSGRYKAWVGHDLTFRWRGLPGLKGAELMGGVLNVGNRGPSLDSSDPGSASTSWDSVRGRTVFLGARLSF